MTTPRVTEVWRTLEPIAADPFVKDLEAAVRPSVEGAATAQTPPTIAPPAAAATRRPGRPRSR